MTMSHVSLGVPDELISTPFRWCRHGYLYSEICVIFCKAFRACSWMYLLLSSRVWRRFSRAHGARWICATKSHEMRMLPQEHLGDEAFFFSKRSDLPPISSLHLSKIVRASLVMFPSCICSQFPIISHLRISWSLAGSSNSSFQQRPLDTALVMCSPKLKQKAA